MKIKKLKREQPSFIDWLNDYKGMPIHVQGWSFGPDFCGTDLIRVTNRFFKLYKEIGSIEYDNTLILEDQEYYTDVETAINKYEKETGKKVKVGIYA